MLLLAALTVAVGIACSSGASDEELSAVQNELEAAQALSQSLESGLAAAQGEVVRLVEEFDLAELRITGLESEPLRREQP